jgi:hypothetical protein
VEKYGKNLVYGDTGQLIGKCSEDVCHKIKGIPSGIGKKFVSVTVKFNTDEKVLNNKKDGGVVIVATLFQMEEKGAKMQSVLVLLYNYKHLKDFKLGHLQKMANLALEGEYNNGPVSVYEYKKLRKVLK